jgi:hypothetical protein
VKAAIDASIDRLEAALVSAGFPAPMPPTDAEPFDRIAEAVLPYRLPDELVRFWQRVDPSTIAVTTFPELVGPAGALELHGVTREFPFASGPPLFFPIAYSSHVHRSIELVSEWSDGGTIFRWAWDEDSFRLDYRSLADLLDAFAELVAEGTLEHRGGFVLVPIDAEEARAAARLDAAGPHPLFGDVREFPGQLEGWPAPWLESSGIELRDREPLGTTHTIAALAEAAEAGPVRGRIAGTVIRLTGIGNDVLVLVDDETGQLDIWCPAGTSPWGPGSGRRFEFEVELEGPLSPPPDFDAGHAEVQQHALSGRLEEAQAAAGEFFGRLERHRPAAVATAIRPLD